MSRTKNALPLTQWEIEEAWRLRQSRLAWKAIAYTLHRDRTGLARAIKRRLIPKTTAMPEIHKVAAE